MRAFSVIAPSTGSPRDCVLVSMRRIPPGRLGVEGVALIRGLRVGEKWLERSRGELLTESETVRRRDRGGVDGGGPWRGCASVEASEVTKSGEVSSLTAPVCEVEYMMARVSRALGSRAGPSTSCRRFRLILVGVVSLSLTFSLLGLVIAKLVLRAARRDVLVYRLIGCRLEAAVEVISTSEAWALFPGGVLLME